VTTRWWDGADVIVCVGGGGVGKTTTAAALALSAAANGRRTVVVTIDPARRLADTLGVRVGDEPTRVEGVEGELWAAMLDARALFDRLVSRHATSTEQRERILANRFYRNIAGALSGTQEYMAAELVHDLTNDDRFDLVIVDTPPAQHAIDFLDAPSRLVRFFDHAVTKVLMLPAQGYLRIVSAATQLVLRSVSKVIGADVLADVATFFELFQGLEKGFRQRANETAALLIAPTTRYVAVTAPTADTVRATTTLMAELGARAVMVDAVIVNRCQPPWASTAIAELPSSSALAPAAVAHAFASARADAEDQISDPLTVAVGGARLLRLAESPTELVDLDALAAIGRQLNVLGSTSTNRSPSRSAR
jgi:anion-transporting  ArsA/GET3 family ATPase